MNMNQDTLIKQIADRENVNVTTIRNIFRSAEDIIFGCLSSVAPSEEININLFTGIHIKRKYIEKKKYSKGIFKDIDCPEHVNVKAYLSKYYNKKVNQHLFYQ